MILLSRKRIFIILSCICLSILTFLLFTTNRKVETIETVALPISDKVIVLDAGQPEIFLTR